MRSGAVFPPDPLTLWLQWYNASSETWSRLAGDIVGTEAFIESASRFMGSYISFYSAFRRASEQYFRNLQLVTRPDIARVASLIVALEEKVDRIEESLEDAQDARSGATTGGAAALEERLGRVESKLDQLLATVGSAPAGRAK